MSSTTPDGLCLREDGGIEVHVVTGAAKLSLVLAAHGAIMLDGMGSGKDVEIERGAGCRARGKSGSAEIDGVARSGRRYVESHAEGV